MISLRECMSDHIPGCMKVLILITRAECPQGFIAPSVLSVVDLLHFVFSQGAIEDHDFIYQSIGPVAVAAK